MIEVEGGNAFFSGILGTTWASAEQDQPTGAHPTGGRSNAITDNAINNTRRGTIVFFTARTAIVCAYTHTHTRETLRRPRGVKNAEPLPFHGGGSIPGAAAKRLLPHAMRARKERPDSPEGHLACLGTCLLGLPLGLRALSSTAVVVRPPPCEHVGRERRTHTHTRAHKRPNLGAAAVERATPMCLPQDEAPPLPVYLSMPACLPDAAAKLPRNCRECVAETNELRHAVLASYTPKPIHVEPTFCSPYLNFLFFAPAFSNIFWTF